jgi:hypothetical protein
MDVSQLSHSAHVGDRARLGEPAQGRPSAATGRDATHRASIRSTLRAPAAVTLLAAGSVHVPLVPEHLREAPYIAVSFIGLAVACAVLALLLARHDSPTIWALTTLLTAAAAVAYLASRTVGLPEIHDDIGNWSDPLGVAALTTEIATAALGIFVLRRARRHRNSNRP